MSSVDRLDDFVTDPGLGPVFRSFSHDERRAMLQDDLFAGRSVSAVLLTIVVAGTLLMLATVLMTL